MQTLKEALVQALDEKFINRQDYIAQKAENQSGKGKFTNNKNRAEVKDQEKELAKKFKAAFGKDNFRIVFKNKEWYVKFSLHAMARYIERNGKLEKAWLEDLLTKMIKVLQIKPKGQMYLVYSVSMKRAMVVNRNDDDAFTVVTVYPEGENANGTATTKKVFIESLLESLKGTVFEGVIDEYVEVE